MSKFIEEYNNIMGDNIFLEKKMTVKDIPLLKKEENEVKGLLKSIKKTIGGLYTAQKELDYLDRNVKGLPITKAKHTKVIGGFSSTATKLYEKLNG